MKKINLLLCDDERLLRLSLADLLRKWAWVNEVDTAANGDDALQQLVKKKYDVLLLDVSMPGKNGVEVAEIALREYPSLSVVILTNYDGNALIVNLYRLGVHGFVLKDTAPEELEIALKTVMQEQRYLTSSVQKIVDMHLSKPYTMPSIKIAHRHKQVLELLVKGKSAKEIAEKLYLSLNTVNSYKADMMELTQTQSTTSLVEFVRKNGLGSFLL